MSSADKLASITPMYFQFKASFSPCIVFEILRYEVDAIARQLAETIRKAPNFFTGSQVVIDLEKMKTADSIDFAALKDLLLAHHMIPIGTRGGTPAQQQMALSIGLPVINLRKPTAEAPKNRVVPQTKLVAYPIRSGMQVCSSDADLIVTAKTSPGAELIAHGHIHVYGCLRGRALAGINGNKEARIFCRTLEAELVAIAGYYLTCDEFPALPQTDRMVQVFLKNEQIHIETF